MYISKYSIFPRGRMSFWMDCFLQRVGKFITVWCFSSRCFYFFKTPFKKGKIVQSGRGVNSILITILQFRSSSWRDCIFCFRWHLFLLIEKIIFKIKLSKTDLPFRFCKIGLPKYFICFRQKNGRLFWFVLFGLLQYFVRFCLT